jgi:hypothetical protein
LSCRHRHRLSPNHHAAYRFHYTSHTGACSVPVVNAGTACRNDPSRLIFGLPKAANDIIHTQPAAERVVDALLPAPPKSICFLGTFHSATTMWVELCINSAYDHRADSNASALFRASRLEAVARAAVRLLTSLFL